MSRFYGGAKEVMAMQNLISYHFCYQSEILFSMELVEGKYEPRQAPTNRHTDISNMVVLFLKLTKYFIKTTSLVFIDSGFYVIKLLLNLIKWAYLSQLPSRSTTTVLSMSMEKTLRGI